MDKYTSQFQLKIDEFGDLYTMKLNKNNRWVQLGSVLPWDELVKVFSKYFSHKGRYGVNPRVVIGALIIKHKLNLSDEETVRQIQENPYMQVFLGLDSFHAAPLFSPTLFVEWRKKLGNEVFNQFSDVLIRICHGDKIDKSNTIKNKGKLKIDATVADQDITFPNDLKLLNEAREKTEKIIDQLYKILRGQLKVKPRTYRKLARKRYLAEAKKRQSNKKSLRMAIRYQLNCLDRNIVSIEKMADMLPQGSQMSYKQLRTLWIIKELNRQQRQMYKTKTNRCNDRIVSISQPYVRPIVRGKVGKKVEFGAKIGLVEMEGFSKALTLSWDAYNESSDLIPHVEAYKELYGYYPEVVMVDKIYGTNANRKWCTERNIRMTLHPKGKRKALTPYEKRKRKKEHNERNHVEAKFGQAKRGYGLNAIRAKLNDTSKSWIGVILFVTNVIKFCEHHNFHF